MTGLMAMTGDIGIQALDPVGKAQALQKFKGPIDGWRLGGLALGAKGCDQIIGFLRTARAQQQLQNPPPGTGQPFAALAASDFGQGEGVGQGITAQARSDSVLMMAIGSHAFLLRAYWISCNRLTIRLDAL